MTDKTSILLTLPSLNDTGGVASYYNGVLPWLSAGNKISPIEIGGTNRAGGAVYPIADQIRFRRAVKRTRPIFIHLNPSLDFKCLVRDGLFAWQAKQLGIPFLVFWHGWDKDFEAKVDQKYLWFFKKTFGHAAACIVLASEFEQKLRHWGVTCPVYRETTNVEESLLDGVDVQGKWLQSQEPAPVKILFLARLERAKGVFETVEAVKLLLDKKKSVQLTVAGDGAIRQELEAFSAELGLSAKEIIFTGDIRDEVKLRAFAGHHVYCLPSSYGEGLPTSVLEAMAFGMPVVTRPVGGLADMFADGKMGRLVQGKTPEEIASCLEELVTDQAKMAEIGRYNAEYAKEHFMASKVAKRLLNIYEQVLDGQIGKRGR